MSSVVLPAPVPPLIRQFSRARTQCDRKSSIGCVSARSVTRSSAFSRSAGKRRIDSSGPSTASGGMMALTREPSGRRASTIGELSSMRRPTPLTMRSMTRSRCWSSWNVADDALEHAAALDEHVLVGVDQDVADRRVAQQRLERPEAEHLVDQLAEQRVALAQAERRALLGEQLAEQRADLALGARRDRRCASASRFRRLSSFRWTFALQLDVLLRAAAAAAAAAVRAGRAWRCGGRGGAHRWFTRGTRAARGRAGSHFGACGRRRLAARDRACAA